jgi:hypothetical protein
MLAGLSLLLSVAMAAMWVRSYWRFDNGFLLGRRGNDYPYVVSIQSMRGATSICWQYPVSPTQSVEKIEWKWGRMTRPYGSFPASVERHLHADWKFLGFWRNHQVKSFANLDAIVIPYWFTALVTGFLGGWRILVTRKRQRQIFRRANNLCLDCGYDLRATPDRCPECGTVPQKTDKLAR